MRRSARSGVAAAIAVCVAACLVGAAGAADTVFWGNDAGNSISYASLDGTDGGVLNTTGAKVDVPAGTAIDAAAGRIYWINQGTNTISYAKLDHSGGGGTLNTSGATISLPSGLAIYPALGRLYWPNFDGSISYARLDGTGGGNLSTAGATVSNARGIAVDPVSGRLYWSNAAGGKISYANLDGSGGGGDLNTAGATTDNPRGVAVDAAAGRIYWSNRNANKISYASLNGGGGADLNTSGATVSGPLGVAVDPGAGRIYWANNSGAKISYARLDGSGGADLGTGTAILSGPDYPVLLRGPVSTATPAITGGSTAGSELTCTGSWAADLLGSFLFRAPRALFYLWTRDLHTIVGATGASYDAVAPGAYRCGIGAANAAGSTSPPFSQPHAITAAPKPRCVVPRGVGRTLLRARAALKKGHCRTGKITRSYLKRVRKGRVLAQKPRAGRKLPNGTTVRLVVSRGRRR